MRDLLLGRPVHDWDIATSARPEQVQALFSRTLPIGIQHGTVVVQLPGFEPVEVTTFRGEGTYTDGRHPDSVTFVRTLREDLERHGFFPLDREWIVAGIAAEAAVRGRIPQ